MKYVWDAGKAVVNRRKHGVSFEEAQEAIESPLAITVDDLKHSLVEEREKTIGPSARGRVLVVVHAHRSEGVIRIVSARKAGRSEVLDYEEEVSRRISEQE